MPTYTSIGSVRGACGHKHRSIAAAQNCADADHRACSRHGGYSDRSVRHADGSGLSENEADQANAARG